MMLTMILSLLNDNKLNNKESINNSNTKSKGDNTIKSYKNICWILCSTFYLLLSFLTEMLNPKQKKQIYEKI